jgi:hypothetical protein
MKLEHVAHTELLQTEYKPWDTKYQLVGPVGHITSREMKSLMHRPVHAPRGVRI